MRLMLFAAAMSLLSWLSGWFMAECSSCLVVFIVAYLIAGVQEFAKDTCWDRLVMHCFLPLAHWRRDDVDIASWSSRSG